MYLCSNRKTKDQINDKHVLNNLNIELISSWSPLTALDLLVYAGLTAVTAENKCIRFFYVNSHFVNIFGAKLTSERSSFCLTADAQLNNLI